MLHHVGNAKRSANLHQFPTRNDHFPAGCQRVEREPHGSGIVVDHNGRDRAGALLKKLPKETIDVHVAFAAFAGIEIELQVRVARRGMCNVLDRTASKRSAPKIRMQNDSSGVDHRSQRVADRGAQFALNRVRKARYQEVDRVLIETAPADFQSGSLQNGPRSCRDRRPSITRDRRLQLRSAHEFIHGG